MWCIVLNVLFIESLSNSAAYRAIFLHCVSGTLNSTNLTQLTRYARSQLICGWGRAAGP